MVTELSLELKATVNVVYDLTQTDKADPAAVAIDKKSTSDISP
jgi:hypothetical protein